MKDKRTRVAIVGAGNVGASTAFCLINQSLCDEVILIDKNREKAEGEAMDLSHCIEYLFRNVKVRDGGYKDCRDADIVVLTASAPMTGDKEDRLAWLDSSKNILHEIVPQVMASGFDGCFVVISNPVDIMAYYVWKLSGLPANQILGTGTSLDTARLKRFIAAHLEVDPRSVNALVLGEHGDSEMIPWSSVTVAGKEFSQILKDSPERLGSVSLDELREHTVSAGWDIIQRKGNTAYGIAAATAAIVRAVLFDENRILPVSTLLNQVHGESGIFAGIPSVLGQNGVKEVVAVPMTGEEESWFHASCQIIREHCAKLFA